MTRSCYRFWLSLLVLVLSTAGLTARGWGAEHDAENDVVNVGGDSSLEEGKQASSVVAILGSSRSAGDAGTVVAVLGDARATGPVTDSVVAVLGDTYVDSKLGGDAVAVLGDVRLGPNADVGGSVVAVGGEVQRDAAAIVRGDTQVVGLGHWGGASGIRTWISHCLIYGRPLSFARGLDWAWSMALAFLALYLACSLLFRDAVVRCAQTFEASPGFSLLAALLSVLLLPMVIVLLCITVIGIAAVPLIAILVVCAAVIGKAAILAWLGWRMTGKNVTTSTIHAALAVLFGGLLILVLYVIPIVGFVAFALFGMLGLGTAIYSLLNGLRARQTGKPQAPGPTAATVPPPQPGPAAAAAAVQPDAAHTLPRAGFWVRMAALLIDVLLVGIIMSVLHAGHDLELIVLAVYGAIMWKQRGSSVGGIVLDLRVVRVDGRAIDWETAIVRALGCFLSLAAVGLGFFWIAFDGAKQAWHDKIAGTVVVRIPKALPIGQPPGAP